MILGNEAGFALLILKVFPPSVCCFILRYPCLFSSLSHAPSPPFELFTCSRWYQQLAKVKPVLKIHKVTLTHKEATKPSFISCGFLRNKGFTEARFNRGKKKKVQSMRNDCLGTISFSCPKIHHRLFENIPESLSFRRWVGPEDTEPWEGPLSNPGW